MKKIIKLLVVLLVFFPFVKVNAGIRVNVSAGADLKNNIYWFDNYNTVGSIAQYTGKKLNDSTGIYHYPTRKYSGSLGGTSFDMVCIDPGMSEGGSTYTCVELNNADIKGLFQNKGSYDEKVFITAVRMKAARYGLITNDKRNSMRVYRSSGYSISAFGEGNEYTRGSSNIGNPTPGNLSSGSIIRQADSIAKTSFGTGTGASTGEDNFTIEVINQQANDFTVKITSNRRMKMVPKITCTSGCDGTPTVNWQVGQNSGTVRLRVKIPSPCKAKLKIEYVPMNGDSGDNLYICYAGGGPSGGGPSGGGSDGSYAYSEQKFITMISEQALNNASSTSGGEQVDNTTPGKKTKDNLEVPISDSFKADYCEPDVECSCPVASQREKNIHFCCEGDSTTSEVKEAKIKDIFCTKKKHCGTEEDINVEGAYDKLAENYDEAYNVPDSGGYCRVYCTERVKVTVPAGIKAVNGKYFNLNGTTGVDHDAGLAGPEISGNYSCRNVIEYDKWVKDYYNSTRRAVKAYNKYQEDLARHDAYKKPFADASKNGEKSYTVKFQYEKDLVGYDARGVNDNGKHTCAGTGEGSCTATMEYEYYIKDSVTVKYGQAKLTYNGSQTGDSLPVKNFERFDVKKDNNESFTTKTGYYGLKYKNNDKTFKCDSINTTGSVSCTVSNWCKTVNADGTCAEYETDPHKLEATDGTIKANSDNHSDKPKDSKSEIDSDNRTDSDVSSDKSNFENIRDNELKKLRNQIKKCDDYFKSDSADYENFLNSKFQVPTVQFEWFYTYLNVNSRVVEKKELLDYIQVGSNCKPTGTGEFTGGEDSETGVQSPHHDTTNPHTNGTYKTFDFDTAIKCNNNGNYCSNGLGEGNLTSMLKQESKDQKYTSDTKFTYECKYKAPDASNKYTVYPYGGYSSAFDENKKAYTLHEGKVYVEYSTLEGTYQTNWYFKGLGSKIGGGAGKFDEDFKNGQDCTGVSNSSVDSAMLFCKFEVERSLTKVRGCESIASLFEGSSHWSNLCCDDPSCEVKNDDTLSFAFKIVDSSNLFPGTTGYTADKAPESFNSSGVKGKYAYNWFNTTKGQTNMKKIEDNSGHEQEFNKERITYEFHLNAKAINTIKEYNAHINNYNSLVAGTYTSGNNTTGPATKYHSRFIEDLYSDKLQLFRMNGSNAVGIGSAVTLKAKTYSAHALDNARARVHWDGN